MEKHSKIKYAQSSSNIQKHAARDLLSTLPKFGGDPWSSFCSSLDEKEEEEEYEYEEQFQVSEVFF